MCVKGGKINENIMENSDKIAVQRENFKIFGKQHMGASLNPGNQSGAGVQSKADNCQLTKPRKYLCNEEVTQAIRTHFSNGGRAH